MLVLAGLQRTGVQDLGGGTLTANLQDGTTLKLTRDGDWGMMTVTRPAGATTVTFVNPVRETDFRPIGAGKAGNIDEADFYTEAMIEEKTGVNLLNAFNLIDTKAPDPKTAAKKNTEMAWARQQLFDAMKSRLIALQRPGQETYKGNPYVGPGAPPPIARYQALKKVVFKFVGDPKTYANWSLFTDAVNAQVAALNADPALNAFGYSFSADIPK